MKSIKDQIKQLSATDGHPSVAGCWLTEVEFKERERLLELQRKEFDRLKSLNNKIFANAGSPHEC